MYITIRKTGESIKVNGPAEIIILGMTARKVRIGVSCEKAVKIEPCTHKGVDFEACQCVDAPQSPDPELGVCPYCTQPLLAGQIDDSQRGLHGECFREAVGE